MSPPRELLTDLDLVEERLELGPWELTLLRPRQAEALLDEDAFEHEEFLPYWAELWKSGLALAEEVVAREVRGLRMVELGCGLGVPSLAASLAGAEVLATDWSPTAIALLQENARRNDVRVETAIVAWAHADALVERAPWDLVLAADVLLRAPKRRRAARPPAAPRFDCPARGPRPASCQGVLDQGGRGLADRAEGDRLRADAPSVPYRRARNRLMPKPARISSTRPRAAPAITSR